MTWIRLGDTFNQAPEVLAGLELERASQDPYFALIIKGAITSLYSWSAQYSTDYKVTRGAMLALFGYSIADEIIDYLTKIGVIVGVQDGQYVLLEREDFFHLIKTTDKAKKTKHRADLNRGSLMVPVLLRDGDHCRYCGEQVIWKDTKSERGGTIDHRDGWEADATPDNVVVACRACNGARKDSPDADKLTPLLDAPERPAYGDYIMDKLKKWRSLTAKTCKAMNIANPLEAPAAKRSSKPSGPAEQLHHAANPFEKVSVISRDNTVVASLPVSGEASSGDATATVSNPSPKQAKRKPRKTRGRGRYINR